MHCNALGLAFQFITWSHLHILWKIVSERDNDKGDRRDAKTKGDTNMISPFKNLFSGILLDKTHSLHLKNNCENVLPLSKCMYHSADNLVRRV